MALVSEDDTHLMGFVMEELSWFLMDGSDEIALRTGPAGRDLLRPGEEFTVRGKIYLMRNDVSTLVRRALADGDSWMF